MQGRQTMIKWGLGPPSGLRTRAAAALAKRLQRACSAPAAESSLGPVTGRWLLTRGAELLCIAGWSNSYFGLLTVARLSAQASAQPTTLLHMNGRNLSVKVQKYAFCRAQIPKISAVAAATSRRARASVQRPASRLTNPTKPHPMACQSIQVVVSVPSSLGLRINKSNSASVRWYESMSSASTMPYTPANTNEARMSSGKSGANWAGCLAAASCEVASFLVLRVT